MSTADNEEVLSDPEEPDEVQEENEDVKIYISLHHVFEGIWMIPTIIPEDLSVWGINNKNNNMKIT